MYFYLKDTGMVFGVQLVEDHRKKGHFILVVINGHMHDAMGK